MTRKLLVVKNLKVYFPVRSGLFGQRTVYVQAVDDLSFAVEEGETVSLVGESGCGKSTVGRAVLLLEKPTAGQILFDGLDLTELTGRELRRMRKDLQIIFQDPYASLNPRQTAAQIIQEALQIQQIVPRADRKKRALELLDIVGLAEYHADRYPHEFSGGQRQRIGIARALALNPKLIICDEAVSALDVSIRAQILNLLKSLQSEFKLTYLFISHDLGVVRHISNRIIVMYLGRIVEIAGKNALFATPYHPYTQALLSAIPLLKPGRQGQRQILKGDVPSAIDPPSGCRFHTRCLYVREYCREVAPELRSIGSQEIEHQVACHYFEEINNNILEP